MAHSITLSLDLDDVSAKSADAIGRFRRWASSAVRRFLARPFFRDINAQYGQALRYPMLDVLAINVLWIHGIALALLLMLDAYAGVPAIFPSPLGWRIIGPAEALVLLAIGVLALSIPLLVKPKVSNHYLWRILLALSLGTFSYLYIYVSGGALTMHFHVLLVITFVAMYADWRLGWLVCGFYALTSLLLDLYAPSMYNAFGHTPVSVPMRIAFAAAVAYFTTVISQNHRRSIKDLLVAKRRNDQFLAIASHELRTPLTSMKGYTEVLERRLKRSSQKDLLSYATKLDDQLSKMTGMIRDLLDVSKLQTGQVDLRRDRLSINSVIGQSVEEVQALAHHHKVVVSGWANTPVIGDPVRLCQVMVNLLSNAMKYSPTSDKVTVRVSEARDKVIISVQDFGIGIPEKELTKIFDPYFRSENAQREDVPGGLGMGLYISAEIIKRHGGRIWVESEVGVGTTFSFLLPLAKESREIVVASKELQRA